MFTKPSRVGKVSSSLTNLLSVSENALHESYQQFWLLGETNLWEALTGNRKEGRRNFRTFICSVGHIPQPENQSSFQAAFSIQLPLSFSLVVFSHKVVSKSCMTPQTVSARFLCPWDFPGKNTGGVSFSSISSQPSDQTRVSCIAGRFLYH